MPIKQYNESGKTYFEAYVNLRSKLQPQIRKQKRKRKILTKKQAEKIEKELYEQAFYEISQIDGNGLLWGQIVTKWIAFKKVDLFEPIGEQTLKDYEASLKIWTKSFWDKPAKLVTKSNIKRVVRDLDEQNRSKSFTSKLIGTIKRIFNWAIEEELIKELHRSPTWGVHVSRKEERTPTILNKQEIITLIQSAKKDNHPWYEIWVVALLTGCRNGELFALTWEDIDLQNNMIRVSKSYNKRLNLTKSTKAGYWRNVPINKELKEVLLSLKKNNTPHVLPRNRDWRHGLQAKILRNYCLSLGITPIRFHDLRACFSTQMLQNNVSPATVMKICGWKDLDTMARYIRLAGVDEEGATNCLDILST